MLINLTNHLVEFWERQQLETAKRDFGEVVDMPFPYIDPRATEKEIQGLAEQYHTAIIHQYGKNAVVHLMGEMCFCFALLKLLQKSKIRTVASTTERIVEQNQNTKNVIFNFVKFRDYI
ncbi:MAG: hypothetical protein Q4A00_04665 [Flavobacteriaceae bacterium]|nr:hypothetical protein [Flavobacteriaceae bacterium]